MSTIQSTDPAVLPLGKRSAFEGVARRQGRRRNPARTTPRSSLRTPTNPPRDTLSVGLKSAAALSRTQKHRTLTTQAMRKPSVVSALLSQGNEHAHLSQTRFVRRSRRSVSSIPGERRSCQPPNSRFQTATARGPGSSLFGNRGYDARRAAAGSVAATKDRPLRHEHRRAACESSPPARGARPGVVVLTRGGSARQAWIRSMSIPGHGFSRGRTKSKRIPGSPGCGRRSGL